MVKIALKVVMMYQIPGIFLIMVMKIAVSITISVWVYIAVYIIL